MSDMTVETIEFEQDGIKKRVVIQYDQDGPNPRADWDAPMGIFAIPEDSRDSHYAHKRKAKSRTGIGVDHEDDLVDRWWLIPNKDDKVPYFDGDPCPCEDKEDCTCGRNGQGEEPGVKALDYFRLGKAEHGPGTVHLYIGGVDAQAGRFDSGQIGWVYSTAERWKYWQGSDWVDTVENRAKLREIIEAELKEYSAFCRGEVYGYTVEKWLPPCEHGHGGEWVDDEPIQSCWGFVGDKDYAIEAAFEAVGVPNPRKKAA